MKGNIKGMMTLAVLAVFGFSTMAFAGWGGGYGHKRGSMMGPGWQQGDHYYDNLSAEEVAKLDQQRAEFFKATENTRQRLYEKELALQSELAKKDPDADTASKLQGEISKLQSDLDQKRLDYDIQAIKSVPIYNRGRGYGPMMGSGRMMGYGHRGGRYCMW